MTTTANTLKAQTRTLYETMDRQDWPATTELIAPSARAHVGGQDLDRDGWLGMGLAFYGAFPDGKHEIEAMIAEGDLVVTRSTWRGTHKAPFMGIPATGRQVALRLITIDRRVDGRLVERWSQFDSIGMMQQLGVMPAG